MPYRFSTEREHIARWVLQRYERLLPEAEMILAEDDHANGEYFCRAKAINNGVAKAGGDMILIADADVVMFPEQIHAAVGQIRFDDTIGWVLPYVNYHELGTASSAELLARDPAHDPSAFIVPSATYPDSTASLAVISLRNFERSGGFDERFIGWGPEDQAWALAVTTLCGPVKRLAGRDCIHIWHPVTQPTRIGNPHYPESVRLWDKYKTASGNPEAMRELVRQWR